MGRGVGVHGQLLPEGFLFASVGKPVVDSHFCDQVRAEALSFGRGYASLETLGSAGNKLYKVRNLNRYLLIFTRKVQEVVIFAHLLHSSTRASLSSLLGFFCLS